MPRTSDHDARREQLAQAARLLIAEAGLRAATVANVAKKAGCSVGLVQHYFPGKDDLLLFTYRQTLSDLGDRVADRIEEGVQHRRSIADVVTAALAELLPLDARRRSEQSVSLALAGRALEQPALATVPAHWRAEVRDRLATAIVNGRECGEVETDIVSTHAAAYLLAVAEGLAGQLYYDTGATSGPVAAEILRLGIGTVFGGECRQYSR